MRRAALILIVVMALLPVTTAGPAHAGPPGPGKPVVRLKARPVSGTAPLEVRFDASASSDPDGGTIAAFKWDFEGDGVVDAESPTGRVDHTYMSAGTVLARVTVIDDEGMSSSKSVRIQVANTAPSAALAVTFDKETLYVPVRADFDASASTDADGSIVSYGWDFDGDGTVDDDTSGAQVSHVYETAGVYLARLVVTDNSGASSETTRLVAVLANEEPSAVFAHTPAESLEAPVEVSFDASASSDPEDATNVSYTWDFDGDGTVDSTAGPQATHTYVAAGFYLATLTVTDTQGASSTATSPLIVGGNQAPSAPTLDTDVTDGVAPLSVFFSATATDPDSEDVTLELTPGDGSPALPVAGSVTHTYVAAGTFTAVMTARDAAGATSIETVQITVDAPPVLGEQTRDPGVVTNVALIAQSLYQGDTPVQTGVDDDELDPAHLAIARGQVLDQAGNPLAGVQVSVQGRDELGVTHSRADGWWDMAVTGGDRLIFDLAKPGFVPSQRSLEPRAGRWELADVTALVPYDATVTEIAFDAPIEVARGSIVTDDRGTRRQTVLFQQDTEATLHHTDGSTETLDRMSVRATEITVGALGKAAMPKLPETVLYNYAVELSVDEARLAGDDTASIEFSKPAFSYTENFRGWVDGSTVPCGYYNRDTGFWDVCDSGVAVTVLDGTTDSDADGIGEAILNTDADPEADTGVDIDADGTQDAEIGADERETLATLYSPGTSLWRVRLDHFSLYDFNPGWIMGAATQPGMSEEDVEGGFDQLDDPCTQSGSVIECENQTLGETLAVAGTANTLNYRSSRAPGRVDDHMLDISLLTDGGVPDGVSYACLKVTVAGVEHSMSLDVHDFSGDGVVDGFASTGEYCHGVPSPSLEVTDSGHARFTWDGLDAYATTVNGVQQAEVELVYWYYVDCSGGSFGLVSSDAPPLIVSGGADGCGWVGLTTIVEKPVGHYSNPADELGGWSLDAHHVYDPNVGILYYGTGGFRRLDPDALGSAANYQISTVAAVPTGEDEYSPWVEGIAVSDALGDIYMADMAGSEGAIWRIHSPGGEVERVGEELGDLGIWGYGPRDIDYEYPYVYIASGTHGLRRLNRETNTIETFTSDEGWDPGEYGNGTGTIELRDLPVQPTSVDVHGEYQYVTTESGDLYQLSASVPSADPVRIFSGPGTPSYGLAADESGAGYVYVGYENHVLRVDRFGNKSVFAGFEGYCPVGSEPGDGDGGPATEACLGSVSGLAWSPSTLFIADGEDQRIRAVSLDTGRIRTVAGTGVAGYSGDGGPAVLAELHSSYNYDNAGGAGIAQHWGIEATDDGDLLIADTNNDVIRKLTPIRPGVDGDDILIPSEDGSVLYQFNEYGRHKHTLNALTLKTLLSFEYNGHGLLAAVVDAFGRRLEIDRTDGQVTLTGPDGGGRQVTTITRDAGGYADTFGYPGGYAVDVSHGTGTDEGLLTGLTDPSGNSHSYEYDWLGRLYRDNAPDGGYKTLTRSPLDPAGKELDDDYAVTVTSLRDAAGDTTTETYTVERDETVGVTRTYTDPTGLTSSTVVDPTGTITTGIQADGTTTRTVLGGDPHWGLLAPYVATADVDIPDRGRQSLTRSRSYTYEGGGSGVVAGFSETVDLTDPSGEVTTTTLDYTWDAGTGEGTVVGTTPTGRTDTSRLDRYGRLVGYDPASIDGVDQEPVSVTYDGSGRIDTVAHGARVTEYDYFGTGESPDDSWLGALESVTDPAGQTTTIVSYDALLRPLDIQTPDGTTSGVRYDDNGNVNRVLMPSNDADHDTHAYGSDSRNRPTIYNPPDLLGPDYGNISQSWNADASPSAFHDEERSYAWNYTPGTGRLDCVDYDTDDTETDTDEARDCGAGGDDATYLTYEAAEDAHPGYLSGITDPSSAWTFTYAGTLLDTIDVTGNVQGQIGLDYNDRLELATLTITGGDDIDYTYDDDGLAEAVGPVDLLLDAVSGALLGTEAGGVTDGYTYTAYGEVETYEATADGATVFESTTTSVDALGRTQARTEVLLGETVEYEYTYTAAGAVDTVTRDGDLIADYDYDDHGNRACDWGTGLYNAQDQVTTCGTLDLYYTPAGDLDYALDTGTWQTTDYHYDTRTGNLAQVDLPDGTVVTYTTDVAGDLATRTQTDPAGNVVDSDRYLYAGGLQPEAQVDSTGNVEAQYVYATAGHVPDVAIVDGATYRLVTDQLGSVRAVIDTATGDVIQTSEYDTWGTLERRRLYDADGNLLCDTSADDCSAELDWQPFGYAGGITDPTTGLVHFGARWYDPELGRWISKDPIGQSGGLNVYQYVGNDPVNWIDPSGLVPFSGSLPVPGMSGWDYRFDDPPPVTDPGRGNHPRHFHVRNPWGEESIRSDYGKGDPGKGWQWRTGKHNKVELKIPSKSASKQLKKFFKKIIPLTIALAVISVGEAYAAGGMDCAAQQAAEEAFDAVSPIPMADVEAAGHSIFDNYAARINRLSGVDEGL